MKLSEIRAMPTVIEGPTVTYHESLVRSYQIVQKAKELLRAGTPADVLIEIIEDLEQRKSSAERQ